MPDPTPAPRPDARPEGVEANDALPDQRWQRLNKRYITGARLRADDFDSLLNLGLEYWQRLRALEAENAALRETVWYVAEGFDTYRHYVAGVFRRAVETATAKLHKDADAVAVLEEALAAEVEQANMLEANILSALNPDEEPNR